MAMMVMRGTARENEVMKKAIARALAPKSKPPFPLAELDELPSAAAAPAARVTSDPRRAVVGRRLASSLAMDTRQNASPVVDARIAARGATQRPPLLIRWLDNDVVVVIIRALATRVVVVDPPRTRVVTGAIVGVGVIIVGVIIIVVVDGGVGVVVE